MTTHPDADALMRAVLDHLGDRVSRLVFADWLEETGTPSNTAWANYIRLVNAETAADPDELAQHAANIRARLTVHVRFFLNRSREFLDLLPPANIRVRLAGFTPGSDAVELLPESLARADLVLPLYRYTVQVGYPLRGLVVVAMANPRNRDVVEKLEFIFGHYVIAIGADLDELADQIDRAWPYITLGTIPFGTVLSDNTWGSGSIAQMAVQPSRNLDVTDPSSPISRLTNLLLDEALSRGATAVQLRQFPGRAATRVAHLIDGTWTDRTPMPVRVLRPLADRLRVLGGLNPDGRRGRVELGSISYPFRDRVYPFLLEITETTAGPDILLQLHDPTD
jgi:uncharacterized protein (TIGR02996 family)